MPIFEPHAQYLPFVIRYSPYKSQYWHCIANQNIFIVFPVCFIEANDEKRAYI